MKKFPGFPQNPATNYWPYPKALNGWWNILTGSEQKALDYILRHTWGFKKHADKISYNQFIRGIKNIDKGCGIKSRATLSRSLKGLEKKGFILKKTAHRKTTQFCLRSPLVQKLNSTSSENELKTSSKSELTIKDSTIKDTNNIYSNIYMSYKKKIEKNARLTDKARGKIKARLKEFSEKELLKAIDNFSKDSWWMKNNSWRGIAWFFHSEDRVLQLVHMKPRQTPPRYVKIS